MTPGLRRFLPWTRPRESQEDVQLAWRDLIAKSRAPELHRVTVRRRRVDGWLRPGWAWWCSCTSWSHGPGWSREQACSDFQQHYERRTH